MQICALCLHVYMFYVHIKLSDLGRLCTHKTCKHVDIGFVVIFYVYMHRCTKRTSFMGILQKERPIQKKTSQSDTHGQKKFKCVHAYMCTHTCKEITALDNVFCSDY
jgi:hypothetical protein